MAQLLPVTSSPNQTLVAALSINGQLVTLNLRLYFNSLQGYWVMDIADQFGNPLVLSVPLVTGVYPAANVLAAYDYLGIGAAYVINLTGSTLDYPNATTLGSQFVLLWDNSPSYVPAA